MNGDYDIIVNCPWCGLGETLADKPAAVNISCRCHECGRVYNIDLEHRRATRVQPKAKPKARAPSTNTHKQ